MKKKIIKSFLFIAAATLVLLFMGKQAPVFAQEEQTGQDSQPVKVTETVSLIQEGVYPQEANKLEYNAGTNWDNAKSAIITGLQNMSSTIDISAYNISENSLSKLYQDAINEDGSLFYITSSLSYYVNSSSYVVISIEPEYIGTASEVSKMKSNFDTAVNDAMSYIDSSMGAAQTALQVHDYLATHAAYDTSVSDNYPKIDHSAYGILVNHVGVCDGYALAFKYLMGKCYNVETYVVTSNTMKHAWNMIKLDGSYYHVDVTFDDPVLSGAENEYQYYVDHEYFLCSDSEIQNACNSKHSGWDNGLTCSSTKYDKSFGKQSAYTSNEYRGAAQGVIGYHSGYWYYVNSNDYAIYQYNFATNTSTKVTAGNFTDWVAAGDSKLYYSKVNANVIYSCNYDGSASATAYTAAGNIDTMMFEKNDLYYSSGTTKTKTTITKTTSATTVIPLKGISLDKATVELMKGKKQQLTVTYNPTNTTQSKDVLWTTSDSSIVSVSDGVVTAVGKGTVTITAQCGSYTATCTVTAEQAGWNKVSGTWYYLNTDGSKRTGWLQDGGGWYYLNSNGAMQTGWVSYAGSWYYLNSNGVMQTGWVKDGSSWYYLNSNGAMQTGWVSYGGNWYYLNSDGVMHTGWVNYRGGWYYLNSNGAMQTGWINDGGKWYYTDANGVMQTSWLKSGNTWYYLNGGGIMQTGWVAVSGKWYYMNSNGAMQTGWVNYGGKWYYLNNDGAMQTGWQNVNGKWYYLYSSGIMAANTTINGYYVNGNGEWVA